MESRLLDLVGENLLDPPAPLTADSDLFEAGLDSMAIMQLVLLLEEHFGVTIDPAELSLDNFRSARRIARLIRSKADAPS